MPRSIYEDAQDVVGGRACAGAGRGCVFVVVLRMPLSGGVVGCVLLVVVV